MKAESGISFPVTERLLSKHLSRRLGWALFFAHAPVLLALCIRTRPWLTGDSKHYLALADALGSGRGFGLGSGAAFEAEAMRMPGYPAFIMACDKVLRQGTLGVVLVQCVLFLCAVWLIWRVTETVFDQLTGLCFLALSALYPFVAFSAAQISAEIPSVFLIALAYFLLLRQTALRLAGAGALLGVAVYFRPNLLLLTAALLPACLLAERKLYPKASLLLVSSALVILCWGVHNYHTFGIFAPTSVVKGSGVSLFMATWQSRVPVEALMRYGEEGPLTPELESSGMIEQVRAVNRQVGVSPDTIFANLTAYRGNEQKILAEKLFAQAALDNIRAWPGTYLRSSASNMLRMWFSAHLPDNVRAPLRVGLIAEGVLVLGLGVVGAVLAVSRESGQSGKLIVFAAVAALLYFTLTLCWLHTEARYTIPVRLLLLMFAAYALKRLLDQRLRINGRSVL